MRDKTSFYFCDCVAGRKCTFKDDTERTKCKCHRVRFFCFKEIRQQYDEQTDESRGCNLLMLNVNRAYTRKSNWTLILWILSVCVRACMRVIRTLNASVSDKDSNCKITASLSRHSFKEDFTIKIKNNQFELWKQCSIFHYMNLSLQVETSDFTLKLNLSLTLQFFTVWFKANSQKQRRTTLLTHWDKKTLSPNPPTAIFQHVNLFHDDQIHLP